MSFWGDFGVICFNHEKVVFGSSKSKNLPKMTHFDTFLYGNHYESEYFLKKCLALRAELGRSAKNIVHPRRFQHFRKCHFGAIQAIQYMSFWGDFRVKIKNNET